MEPGLSPKFPAFRRPRLRHVSGVGPSGDSPKPAVFSMSLLYSLRKLNVILLSDALDETDPKHLGNLIKYLREGLSPK